MLNADTDSERPRKTFIGLYNFSIFNGFAVTVELPR
jgi:hypothetical protein